MRMVCGEFQKLKDSEAVDRCKRNGISINWCPLLINKCELGLEFLFNDLLFLHWVSVDVTVCRIWVMRGPEFY